MIETIKNGIQINMGDREKMAEMLIESFGQNLPENIKKKIMSQFRTLSKENLRAFYEHGLFVISTKKIGDLVNLANIKAKTILIHGENDTIIDLEDVKFLASQIPDCEIKIVKNAGHFLHLEREGVFGIYQDIFSVKKVPV